MTPKKINLMVAKYLEKTIKTSPNYAIPYLELAKITYFRFSSFELTQEESNKKAEKLLLKAISIDPNNELFSRFELAEFFRDQKRKKEALEQYELVLKIIIANPHIEEQDFGIIDKPDIKRIKEIIRELKKETRNPVFAIQQRIRQVFT